MSGSSTLTGDTTRGSSDTYPFYGAKPSQIQTQIDGKQPSVNYLTSSSLNVYFTSESIGKYTRYNSVNFISSYMFVIFQI